jgi:hypothetical protein
MELSRPLKVALKLVLKVLAPRPIERRNVMLAVGLFHKSTIAALCFDSETHSEWSVTADFLEIVRTCWSIVNVRTTSLGNKKRDDIKDPALLPITIKLSF